MVQENADPDVMKDMKNFFDKLVPMDESYIHGLEGKDDMPAHIKSALQTQIYQFQFKKKNLVLGTWQGFTYLSIE